jgi:hypothetical protein
MIIVALSGWKESGKDTAAELLIGEYGFERIAFADPLKLAVARDFGVAIESLHSQVDKEAPILTMPVDPKDHYSKMITEFMVREFRTQDGRKCEHAVYVGGTRFMGIGDDNNFVQLYWTGRALCILEGSTKRTASPDYWVEKAVKTAKEAALARLFVISDLRYKNEITALRKSLGEDDVLITVRIDRFDHNPSVDPSECDLDDAEFDIILQNRGTKEEFEGAIHRMGKHLAIEVSGAVPMDDYK